MAKQSKALTPFVRQWDFDRAKPEITLDGCLEVIHNLAQAGARNVHPLLACWAGVMSIQQELAKNGKAVRILSRLLDEGLPEDYDAVHEILKPARVAFLSTHFNGLVGIQQAYREGRLPEMPEDDWTIEQWEAWREDMTKLPGVGRKVASFIGLLVCPETCPLVPVDRWVMRRFGFAEDASPKSKVAYEFVEGLVREERDRNGHASLPLGAWHWFKWSEARQAAGAETPRERPECHCALSPRDY